MSHRPVITLLLSLFCVTCKNPAPEKKINVQELTIAQVHEGLRNKLFTSEGLVRHYLRRIQEKDSSLQAIISINPDAIEIAHRLDDEFKTTGKLRPLHGIPVIVKDNIHTKGLKTTAGALALNNFIPDEDAFIIDKLVTAGAVVIAKSNMAEWAFTPWSSVSTLGGMTLNPYNLDYSPAGSSGGTAAAIAANFGIIGLGTDTGNSIRGPSSHCALVGFRATMGLVSRQGVVPLFLRNDMAGPMCRTVEDAVRVLEVIAGVDPDDSITVNSEGKVPKNLVQYLKKDGLNGARIGVLRGIGDVPQDPEISILLDRAIRDMRTMGAVLVDSVQIPGFDDLKQNQWCNEFKRDIEGYLAQYSKSDSLKSLQDIIRVGTKVAFTAAQLKNALQFPARSPNSSIPCLDAWTDIRRVSFRKAIEEYMDRMNLDALVYPSWNVKPARADQVFLSYADGPGVNSAVISPHTAQPAFTVPMGFMNANLPVGLEFIGRMYAEPTLIRLVYAYEQGTRHRKPPPD
jgi:amidase